MGVKDGVIYFRADARYRSKIGVAPQRALPIAGSYDSGKQALTLVQYNQPADTTDYVNSLWKIQDQPFAGDVVNAYTDGPNDEGKTLGNFYEMETSSNAVELRPGQTIEHVHRTIHINGDETRLDAIAHKVLGVHLNNVPLDSAATK